MDAGKVFQTVCFYKLLKKIENGLKGGKNISATLGCASSATFPTFVLPHFLRHLLSFPDGRIENRNLFVQLTQIRFQLDIEGNPQIFRFVWLPFWLIQKDSRHFFNQSDPELEPISYVFPRLKLFAFLYSGFSLAPRDIFRTPDWLLWYRKFCFPTLEKRSISKAMWLGCHAILGDPAIVSRFQFRAGEPDLKSTQNPWISEDGVTPNPQDDPKGKSFVDSW